jgi:hypothetical protein
MEFKKKIAQSGGFFLVLFLEMFYSVPRKKRKEL